MCLDKGMLEIVRQEQNEDRISETNANTTSVSREIAVRTTCLVHGLHSLAMQ
jgi:hypothetical protein